MRCCRRSSSSSACGWCCRSTLQAVFGVLLMRVVTRHVSLQLLGAMLIVLSPPLFYRINHAALTAHWLVLAALWLSLRADGDAPSARWPRRGRACGCDRGHAAVHPADGRAADARGARAAGDRGTATDLCVASLHAAVALGAPWSCAVAIGQPDGSRERGSRSRRLRRVVDQPARRSSCRQKRSRFCIPGSFRYDHKEQYQGYAYLGLGMLLLAVVSRCSQRSGCCGVPSGGAGACAICRSLWRCCS